MGGARRTRPSGAGGRGLSPRSTGRRLRRAGLLALLLTACSTISGGDEPVAIEFTAAPTTVAVGDTVFMPIRVLSRSGDPVPGAPISLTSLNPDTLGIDSTTQSVIGLMAGPGRIVASSGNLRSEPFLITVTP